MVATHGILEGSSDMRAWTILLVLMLVACADRSVPVDSDPRAVKEAAALSYTKIACGHRRFLPLRLADSNLDRR